MIGVCPFLAAHRDGPGVAGRRVEPSVAGESGKSRSSQLASRSLPEHAASGRRRFHSAREKPMPARSAPAIVKETEPHPGSQWRGGGVFLRGELGRGYDDHPQEQSYRARRDSQLKSGAACAGRAAGCYGKPSAIFKRARDLQAAGSGPPAGTGVNSPCLQPTWRGGPASKPSWHLAWTLRVFPGRAWHHCLPVAQRPAFHRGPARGA
jgi:hypothetical protein